MSKKIYGQWAGNPKGTGIEDETLCCVEVFDREIMSLSYQCKRKRGYGLEGKYCKQHSKKYKAKEDEDN